MVDFDVVKKVGTLKDGKKSTLEKKPSQRTLQLSLLRSLDRDISRR
jgi:hypothetical protein